MASRKHTYAEMIQIGLHTLNERDGSSRQELWKCIQAKYPESDYRSYLVRLKKLTSESKSFVVHGKNVQRFKLEKKFRVKLQKRIDKGLPIIKAINSASMTDPVKKAMKKPKKVSKPKSQKPKTKQSRSSKKDSSTTAKQTKGKSTKQSKKQTSESRETKAKLKTKRSMGTK